MKTKEELFEDLKKEAIAKMHADMPMIVGKMLILKNMPMIDENIEMVVDIYSEGLQRGIEICTGAMEKMTLYKITDDILNRGCEDK